jgi:DNA-binding CsgD family transcriptional regulator
MPGLVEIYRKSAERRRLLESLDDTDARRQLEIRENVERFQRIGHDAAAELHDRVTRGEAPYAVQREIALRLKLPVGVLGGFIADARRAIRKAREQERATEILHLNRAGHSNVEIGRALDMTPQHVGRLLRKAQATFIGSSHA